MWCRAQRGLGGRLKSPTSLLFIPCFNEAGRIGALLDRVARVDEMIDEVVVVDDGSTDESLVEVSASRLACTVLRHRERRGLGEVFRTAYRYTLSRGHDVFCVMAGNGKDDPADLTNVIGPVRDGLADYVQGSRFHPAGGRSERLPLHRGVAIRAFTLAVSAICHRHFYDCSNGFRAYRTDLLRDERIDWCAEWLGSSYQIEIHLLLSAVHLGYHVKEVPTTKRYPTDDKPYSKASAIDWFNLAKPLAWRLLALDRVRGQRRAPGGSHPDGVELVRGASSA